MHVTIRDDEFNEDVGIMSDYLENIETKPTILEDLYYKIALKNNIYWIEAN